MTYRILVIDDNAAIHEDFRKILMKSVKPSDRLQDMESALFGAGSQTQAKKITSFEIDYASQGRDGLEMVKQALSAGRPYALAFVDGRMPPGWDGIETINRLWQVSPDLQVVLCTAYSDYSWEEIRHVLGESDNLLILKKPFDNVEVLQIAHALTGKWELNREIETRLIQLAYYDSLTDLPNRILFVDRLTHTIDVARRYQHQAALLFIDLDNFKQVNDTLGHSIGDELLKIIATRITKCLRVSDTLARMPAGEIVARLGGDEFAVILTKLNKGEDAALVAQRITRQLDKPILIQSHQVVVTACIGIAIFPQDGDTVEALLQNADSAMYFAKHIGPRMFNFYHKSMYATALRKMTIDEQLRQALDRNELTLHYQPQIDMITEQVTGMEALLRWHNVELGNVPPLEFIPVAEETGFIVTIGEWVLRTACKQAKTWLDQGFPLRRIAINVSVRQITHPNFLEMVRKVLVETALEPKRLEIEITESLFMKNLPEIIVTLRKLKKMGVQIAIDDFGIGFSSLSYLKELPISHLKIDRTFVGGIGRQDGDQTIVRAIIALAESMKLQVIAEGVETTGQFDFLRGKHCQEAQGYLFSRPLPLEEAEIFLGEPHPPAGGTGTTEKVPPS